MNKNAYNILILAPIDTVCIQMVEIFVTDKYPNGHALMAWTGLNNILQPNNSSLESWLHKKFANS